MADKGKYRTKQRTALMDYVTSIPGQHFTAADACGYFHDKKIPIGTTTVYRQIEKLVDEGVLRKYIIDETSSACFEYAGDINSDRCKEHFHMKCEVCGKLIHLECNDIQMLQKHIEEHHDFRINPFRTVFYGTCGACMKKEEKEALEDGE